ERDAEPSLRSETSRARYELPARRPTISSRGPYAPAAPLPAWQSLFATSEPTPRGPFLADRPHAGPPDRQLLFAVDTNDDLPDLAVTLYWRDRRANGTWGAVKTKGSLID